jgi:putative nucleotidyltransferase with HDIG domain
MLAAIAGGLVMEQQLSFVLQHALLSGVVTFAAAGAIALLLPFIERIFNTVTSLSLLEWRDPTKPLLQLLAREAPGTYSHSLVLGTLADAACEKIGADGLLTQVGALYHDIGKIHRPSYFTENQEGRISRHENLSPTMSLLIILGHVKDGLELARQYKLPRLLHQFIAEHHGTTVVRYFHRMASEKQPHIASGRHDREVAEADFRYSGPRPHSKESAVLMLCDGVEGAVRSLGEPTVGRIESTVQQIVADRLNDGQFDECDITLREIRLVEDSLIKSLCSIYHGRVAYPKPVKAEQVKERQRLTV